VGEGGVEVAVDVVVVGVVMVVGVVGVVGDTGNVCRLVGSKGFFRG